LLRRPLTHVPSLIRFRTTSGDVFGALPYEWSHRAARRLLGRREFARQNGGFAGVVRMDVMLSVPFEPRTPIVSRPSMSVPGPNAQQASFQQRAGASARDLLAQIAVARAGSMEAVRTKTVRLPIAENSLTRARRASG